MTAFDQCLPIVLREEGGFADLANDPGNVTMLGVTQANWQSWVGHAVTEADMRALTPAIVTPFYLARFWQAMLCDNMPVALALCVFDFGVNGGDSRAARYLQQMVNVPQDGHIGPVTLRALQQLVGSIGLKAAIVRYQGAREDFYRDCDGFQYFGNGWLNRVAYVQAQAETMI